MVEEKIKISNKFEIGKFMTFDLSKEAPIYNWFYYKEGYAPQMVEYCLDYFKKGMAGKTPQNILDPFCGAGTTLLYAKNSNIPSIGVDASYLATFVSKTKVDNYEQTDLEEIEKFSNKIDKSHNPKIKWEFELFDTRAAFPKRNLGEILGIREKIEDIENEKARNIAMLALLSVLPQTSVILKDGGVLKIDRNKMAAPAKKLFKRKLKKMAADIKNSQSKPEVPQVILGDAREMELENDSIDLCITSPPYLNNVDYSKIYGLELSLLTLTKNEAENTRSRSVRSFIGKRTQSEDSEVPQEVGEIGTQIPIVGNYFVDMEKNINELHRVLKENAQAHIIVSNSVIHENHILVDEILAQIGMRIGFSGAEIIVGAERIADVKPQKVKTRESIVILKK